MIDWPQERLVSIAPRYRIRKPRGLTILENLLAAHPAPAKPVEAAQ